MWAGSVPQISWKASSPAYKDKVSRNTYEFSIWTVIGGTRQWCDICISVSPSPFSQTLFYIFREGNCVLRTLRGFCIWVKVIVPMQRKVDALVRLMPLQVLLMNCWVFFEMNLDKENFFFFFLTNLFICTSCTAFVILLHQMVWCQLQGSMSCC